MEFPPLQPATLLRRYKRFLADVRLVDGSEVTVHCPNTGAMTGCAEPGATVWLSDSPDKKRKYRFGWWLTEAGADMICIHSARANDLVAESLAEAAIPELAGYVDCRREVAIGSNGSRVDFVLESPGGRCAVEVKSVTLRRDDGCGLFPDTVSLRARKHLRELMAFRAAGHRAVLLFASLHTGITAVAPADAIDPAYGQVLREAMTAGVEVLALGADIDTRRMRLVRSLPVMV